MEKTQSALQSILTLHGDLNKPIPPGAVFASLPPQEQFHAVDGLADSPYPPIVPNTSNCTFDPEDRTLKATCWGKAVFTSKGIRIKPCWKISHDKMILSLEVNHQDLTGEAITLERIQAHMPESLNDITQDLDFKSVSTALEKSAKTNRSITVTMAEGALPGMGHDAHLKLTFNAGQAAGTLRKDGSMDFRERADLHSVAEGDLLGELFPPKTGDYGYDLFGNPINPPEVQKLKVSTGQGVAVDLNNEGTTIYTATQTGMARFNHGILEVTELLVVPGDVDFTTGNIHATHGSIHIKGDVKCGFTVESTGDIIIDGVVEEADIIAGGLVIAGGVIMNGKNKIVAEGDVSAHFFRNAVIEAGGNVSADQELANCTVIAEGEVTVLGAKGIISGGHIISGETIHASIIGNKACVETSVEIRIPDETGDKLEAARHQLEEELHKLDKAIGVDFELSSLMSAPEEDRHILAELIKVRGRLQTEIRNIDETNKRILEEAQKEISAKHVKADQKVYCGTQVIICGKLFQVKNDMNAPSYFFDIEAQQVAWN